MKVLLVLSFYLMTFAFVSGINLNETSLLFRPKATNIQNPIQRAFLLSPREKERKIGKIIFLKHLMELKCLKKALEDIHDKNQWNYQRCHKPLKLSFGRLNFKPNSNLTSKVEKATQTPARVEPKDSQNKRNTEDSRIILLPYRRKITKEHIDKYLKNKPTASPTAIKEVTPDTKFTQSTSLNPELCKNDENSKVFTKVVNGSKKIFSGRKDFHQFKKPNQNVYSKPIAHPVARHNLKNLKRIQPYELKQLFREKLFQLKNMSNFENHQKNYLEPPFLKRKPGRKAENQKPLAYDLYIKKNNKSKSLGTLVKPVNSSVFLKKEVFSNSSSRSSHIISDSRDFVIHLNNSFLDLEKKATESKSKVDPQSETKQQEMSTPHFSTVVTKSVIPETVTDFPTTVKVVEDSFTTVTNAPISIITTKFIIKNETKNAEPTTVEPELRTVTPPKMTDEPNVLFKNQKFSTVTSLPLTTNEINKFIPEESATVTSSNFLFTSLTTAMESLKFSFLDFQRKTTNTPDVTENFENIATETDFPEITRRIFTQFTNRPLTTDSTITNKKDLDNVGKNSRKMHFNIETLTTTTPKSKNSEQRRSDILIDDLEDYSLQDSNFSLHYMKQLKENNNLNSSDYIIQLIPFVISDLRENKFSADDITILSKTFGDYWPTVLTLTNSTNLDMLPLLKMKNEEDLNKILSTFFPENSDTNLISSKLPEESSDKVQSYYYEDYIDMSKEQEDYWKNEETFQFKREVIPKRYFEKLKIEPTEE